MRKRTIILLALSFAFVICASGWTALAIYYSDLRSAAVRTALAWAFLGAGLATLCALVLARWRWKAFAAFSAAFVLALAWWMGIEPSNDRDWQPDVAVLPHATIDGTRVTVHNIRNFRYRSETDFIPAYYDRTFEIGDLEAMDVIASYWMGPAIAHVFVSFGFRGGEHLAVSIETRKERGEGYSTISGFFKQYELFYVIADERDAIGLRANHRQDPPEDVYVYRVQGPVENARRLFFDYMRAINSLREKPQFYNTLTTNCTTSIWMHTKINPGHLGFSWKLLLSGYVPRYLYDEGRLGTGVPFAELQRRSHVNARAAAAERSEKFSELIRRVESN